ncbi:MAG: NAD(P)H-dependent oxidoreductase [Gemmatimonadales bacterium]|nr:MAG: NAD(P)H-dependent oxidoreductase [Gemmatimonadales bacterium]
MTQPADEKDRTGTHTDPGDQAPADAGAGATGSGYAPENLVILTLCGSLRKASYNRALLLAAGELAPEGLTLEDGPNLGDLPFYNPDIDGDDPPAVATEFRSALRRVDGLIIVSPEYNYGMPAVVKNAIDWASRPVKDPPITGLPTLLLGASGGASGTIRAQLALHHALFTTSTPVLHRPGFHLTFASKKFEDGRLHDEASRELLGKTLKTFGDWIRAGCPVGRDGF